MRKVIVIAVREYQAAVRTKMFIISLVFIPAGAGSCAGTGHEGVYKAVASRLMEVSPAFTGNETGGLFKD